MKKKRLDQRVVEEGLAPSREKAQRLILANEVLVDDQPVTKAGALVGLDKAIRLRNEPDPYVSRGAYKLLKAIEEFQIEVREKICLDVGSSTGGFTQVLLEKGAKKVFCIDVGTNQMDWKIRQDPRVVLKEKVNARHLTFDEVGQTVDLIVMDVSFISLEKIIPALPQFHSDQTQWVTLIKPQFEVGPENVGKGGIVSSERARKEAVDRVCQFGQTLGMQAVAVIESPIKGTKGNIEFLAHWRKKTS